MMQLSLPVYVAHRTPAFAPLPFPLPASSLYTLSRSLSHTHTLTFKHTTHIGFFTTFFSHEDSLSLSRTHTLTHTHTHTHTHTDCSHLSSQPDTHPRWCIASTENAKNSLTRNSPHFSLSPFPLVLPPPPRHPHPSTPTPPPPPPPPPHLRPSCPPPHLSLSGRQSSTVV